MTFFERLLMIPTARVPITPDLLPKYARVIETELKFRNRLAHEKFPKALYLRLAQEAFRRVAERSGGGIVRSWGMYLEVESVYKNLELIFRGENADSAIQHLILYNGVDIETIVAATKSNEPTSRYDPGT